MILIWLIGILLVAGILAWLTARWSAQLPRWIALIAIGIDLVLATRIWAGRASSATEVSFEIPIATSDLQNADLQDDLSMTGLRGTDILF